MIPFRSLLIAIGLITTSFTSFLCSQEDAQPPKKTVKLPELPFADQEPHDRIYLTQQAGGHVIRVAPLPFPGRIVPPNPMNGSRLQIVWLERPDLKFEINWSDIERIDLYEQMVLKEAEKAAEENDFTTAFRLLAFLFRDYPETPNLEGLRRKFLLKNSSYLYQQKQPQQALLVVEELYRTASDYEADKVRVAINRLVDDLLREEETQGDVSGARKLMQRLNAEYPQLQLDSVSKAIARFESKAAEKRAKSIELKEQGKLREARQLALEALATWPDAQGSQELVNELNVLYPLVRVGVMQRATELDPASLTNWPARRVGSLLQRSLFELRKTGPEGGAYLFTLGRFQQSDDRQQLILNIANSPQGESRLDSYWLAQWLARRADPDSTEYLASWASIAKAINVQSPTQLTINLRAPHVLPQALLQWQLPLEEIQKDGGGAALMGPYVNGPVEGDSASFVLRTDRQRLERQPIEIVERVYDDGAKAINDLLRGEVDILDQVFPADAARLESIPGIRVEQYALPSVHMLVPRKTNHAFLKKAEFRRALLYAANREGILNQELLGGSRASDGKVISGPFPAGTSADDPLSYAYDFSVNPYIYEPRLAKLLVSLTEKQLKEMAVKAKEPPPKLEKIRLGIPQQDMAKIAGEAIVQQWNLVGIPAELVQLPAGQAIDTDGSCDLVYVTAAMWEPATDAERLLGADGIASAENAFIVQGIRSLRNARNWREVRERTHELHRLVHFHLPIIPLWQINDRFAVRKEIEGVASRPITIYQDIQRWRLK